MEPRSTNVSENLLGGLEEQQTHFESGESKLFFIKLLHKNS